MRRVETSVNVYTRSVVITLDHLKGDALSLLLYLLIGLTHEALDRVDCVRWVRDSLTLSGVTHLALTTLYECYY